jgi:hypothetical protein
MNKQILKDLAKYFRLEGDVTFEFNNILFVQTKAIYKRYKKKVIMQYVPIFISDNGNICSIEANKYVSNQIKNFLDKKYNEQNYQ